MYPHRFNHSHSRPHRDRSPRPRNSHCDSWERKDSYRERERQMRHKYSPEGRSRKRDYSTSPKRPYRKDSSDADRSRRSPLRRRKSFEGDGSRHNLDNANDGGEGYYRSRLVSEGNRRRWSSDTSDVCGTQDFDEFQGKHFRHNKTSPDYRHHQKEVNNHHSRDSVSRSSSARNKDINDHKNGFCSSERKPSEGHSSKYYESDVAQNQAAVCQESTSAKGFQRFLNLLNKGVDTDMLNKIKDRNGHKSEYGSSERKPSEGHSSKYYESDVAQNQAAVCQQSTSAKGFQRFLDLLNKGVDVDMLNKIVAQTPSDHGAQSTLDIDGQRDKTPQLCSETPIGWQVSEQSGQRSVSWERSSHPRDSRSHSPSPPKVALTRADEHKCKQMQDVLQAIGLNLGFEELGQMSHRIQERLYGKKESEEQGEGKTKEKDSRKVRLPSPRSRSSCSSRSQSPPDRHVERSSSQAARPGDQRPGYQYLGDQHPGDQHPGDQQPGDQYRGDQHLRDQYRGNWHPSNQHSAKSKYQVGFPPPTLPAYPLVYPPANYPLLPCRPPPPPLPHITTVPAAFLPQQPPFPHAPLPLLNRFPQQMAQQYAVGPQPWFPPLVHPMDNNYYEKAKTPSRPRCLQVIETKQAG